VKKSIKATVAPGTRKSMRSNRSRDTRPELALRRALWGAGLRGFRKNLRTLPGKPDIVFTKHKLCVFVHGCFWHGCAKCAERRNLRPATNRDYWQSKLHTNQRRDAIATESLQGAGWQVLVVWECEIKSSVGLAVSTISQALCLDQDASQIQSRRATPDGL